MFYTSIKIPYGFLCELANGDRRGRQFIPNFAPPQKNISKIFLKNQKGGWLKGSSEFDHPGDDRSKGLALDGFGQIIIHACG